MPDQPISLNLARIVHRLMTSPRGWRVSHLRDELGIAQRTYRKYRQTLQHDFLPWRRRDGTSAVFETTDGDARYLRLRPPRTISSADPDLEALAAAVHLARSMMLALGSEPFERAADILMDDFRHSLRDRDFIMRSILADADRMFVVDGPTVGASDTVVSNLIRAVTNRRYVRVHLDGVWRTAAPLTILLRASGLFCALRFDGVPSVVPVGRLEAVDILPDQFDYPSAAAWSPAYESESD